MAGFHQKAPDQRAVELLIKKITVSRENNKTDFKIESNLKSVCVEMVRVVITDLAANDHFPLMQNSLQ